ncbi:hypothetical protein NPIL_575521 [Nephila pilipes]|uniref:tRNA (uracil(54)-C(5))-methyltransferase n=1 Tax=Nephila pilipes TaxID=299642 RepID=A0A8X6TLF5_NEPPI|nr:hypothetical protein NPIL_575521 [Nephila pilipes]
MALSVRKVCLPRNLNFYLFKNNYIIVLSSQNPVRYLRGSRHGFRRVLGRTESKFQELIKSVKESSKKSVVNTSKVPDTLLKSTSPKDESSKISTKLHDTPHEDIHKRLDGIITPLKNLTYARQLERKYGKCLSLLRMFGERLRSLKMPIALGADKLPCPVELMLPSTIIEAYRNQDEFSIGIGADGNPQTVGFFIESLEGALKNVCVSPDNLVIIKNNHKNFVKDFENYINSSIPPTLQDGDGSYWKSISMRSNMAGDIMGIILLNNQGLSPKQIQQEKKNLREYFEKSGQHYNLKSLYFQENFLCKAANDQSPYELLFGESYIIEELNGLKFRISPQSFFPRNTNAAGSMYNALKQLCRVNDSTTVLDIFCGTGPVSLTFSPNVKKCIGFDTCSKSIEDAKFNSQLNNLSNTEFIHGSPEAVLRDIFTCDYHSDLVAIVNSSKVELSKTAIRFLRECKYLKKVIYISTKPRTAVDNFIRLCKPAGSESYLGKYFVPVFALPVDLCPQTEHYGLIMMFQRL